jgi:hypothetical protein
VDTSGNLYIADGGNQRIRKVDVSDPPSLSCASTPFGAASAAQDVTVLNLGNSPLTIDLISTADNFSLSGSDTTCSSSSQTLAPAASCVLGFEFNPASAGSINGGVVLTDNALNASTAMQTITLQGTGLQQSQTINFPNPGAQIYAGAPVTITMSATASSGLPVSYTVISGSATVSGTTLVITGVGSVTVETFQAGDSTYAAATPVSDTFAVNPLLAPTLTNLSPAWATAGWAAFALTVNGSNFDSSAVVNWNSNALTTTYVSASQLTAAVPANLIATAGTASVAVTTTGGTSSALTFTIQTASSAGAGTITTVAGNGAQGYSGDGGLATSAALYSPQGVAVDASGNLYIADTSNNVIRKVTPGGTITTVAGNGSPTCVYTSGVGWTGCYGGDGGPATSAELHAPYGVAVDAFGNLYIADYYNNRIRMVAPNGTITTVVGNGYGVGIVGGYSGDGGPATSAELNNPSGVTVDASGNLYIADTLNQRIREVTPGGTITTVAGNGSCAIKDANGKCFSGDGGPATSAELLYPTGLALDASGNLYIADWGNERIRKVTPDGTISTVAGNGSPSCTSSNGVATACYGGDGGPATNAELSGPNGVTLDASGNLYIADYGNNRIRKVTTGGTMTTVAGNGSLICTYSNGVATGCYGGDGGPATSAELFSPTGVALDASGNLYIADDINNRIREVYSASRGSLQSQTITFPNPGTQTYGVTPITLAATASSGLAVSYAVTSGPATVSGTTLTFTGTGSITVQATQQGDGVNWAAATPVSVSFTVTPAVLTVTPNSTFVAFGAAIPTLTGALTGVVAGDGITVSYTTTAAQGSPVGTYPITAMLDDPNNKLGNYSVTNTPGTLAVTQAPQTINFVSPGTQTYGVAPITLTATATSGLAVTYTVTSGPATVSGSTLTFTGAGMVTVQAIQAGNSTYSMAVPVNVSFAVNAGTQTITFPNPGIQTYSKTSIVLNAAANSGLPVTYIVTSGPATVNGSTLTFTGTGSITVEATQLGNANYSAATPVSVTFTVTNLTAAAPTMSPAPYTYSTPQTVTLADASPGVTIYYTTDGTTPTTASQQYTAPITVSTTTTIQAIAIGNGYGTSGIAMGIYKIKVP